MSIPALLTHTAARVPDKVALIEPGGRRVTYATFEAEANRVAAGLQQRGLEPGDRVALALPNIAEFPFAYFGALRAGAIVVPLNVLLTARELTGIVADHQPRFCISSDDLMDQVRGAAPDATVLEVGRWNEVAPDGSVPEPVPIADDDIAVLAYTSGTTGVPKGAMLSHGNLRANLDQQMAIPTDTVSEDDILFFSLPLFHIFGLNVPLGLLTMNGATGVLVSRFEPVEALRLIAEHRASVVFGAPPMFVAWVETPGADQYDLSSVRLAVSGAAALSETVLQDFQALFGVPIFEGYGLTETAPTLTTNRMADEPRARSIGKPLPGVELRLVDESMEDVVIGDPGEIIVRGPNVFKGYWNSPDETERAFTDGWLRTGDVAIRDEEGYLYIVDRKRDLVIVSGFNVFPSEVEEALLQNPLVAEAAVVGEPHPYTGETVKAFVVLETGEHATEEQLLADVSERLARFKCPTAIEIVPDLPHLLTGKILRRALRT